MRIKILGDCYYCISGLPAPDPDDKDKTVNNLDHAKNSVEMGLEMIELIREVREEFNVEGLDMRIGVHTGEVLSGLIGLRKWQFDIWSNDVTIANHMESSGKPGHVHITEKTREKLEDSFECVKVTDMSDEVILDSGLQTYLIRGQKHEGEEEARFKEKVSKIRGDNHGRQFSDDSGIGSNESSEVTARTSKVVFQEEPEVNTFETSFSSGGGRRRSSTGPLRRGSVSADTVGGFGGRRRSSVFQLGDNRRKSNILGFTDHLCGFVELVNNTEKFMEKEIEQLPIRLQE